MRPSLLPGLLVRRGAQREARRQQRAAVRDRPALSRRRASARRSAWSSPASAARAAGRAARRRPYDAFDAKAEALALLAAAGAPVDNLQVMGEAGDAWHPGQSGTLRLGPKTVLAAFGMLHPRVRKAFDLDGRGRGGRAVSRRDPGKARGRLHAPGLCAARDAGGAARFRVPRPRRPCRRRAGPRGEGRGQGGDRLGARVRRVREGRRDSRWRSRWCCSRATRRSSRPS